MAEFDLTPEELNSLLLQLSPEVQRQRLDVPIDKNVSDVHLNLNRLEEVDDAKEGEILVSAANVRSSPVAKNIALTYFCSLLNKKTFFFLDTARDKRGSSPYVGEIIKKMLTDKMQGTAIIPLLQEDRKQMVLLEVDLADPKQQKIIVHDWSSTFNKRWHHLRYSDHLKNVIYDLNFYDPNLKFTYQYKCYNAQDNEYLSSYYTHQAIRSLSNHGDFTRLNEIGMTTSDVVSKKYYLQNWNSSILYSSPKRKLSALAITGATLGLIAIMFGIANIWNPIGLAILGLTSSIAVIAAGTSLAIFSLGKNRQGHSVAGVSGLGVGLAGLGLAVLALELLSNPIGWGILGLGACCLLGGYTMQKWQNYQLERSIQQKAAPFEKSTLSTSAASSSTYSANPNLSRMVRDTTAQPGPAAPSSRAVTAASTGTPTVRPSPVRVVPLPTLEGRRLS